MRSGRGPWLPTDLIGDIISFSCQWLNLHSYRQVCRAWRAAADALALELYRVPSTAYHFLPHPIQDESSRVSQLALVNVAIGKLRQWLGNLVRAPAAVLVYYCGDSGLDLEKLHCIRHKAAEPELTPKAALLRALARELGRQPPSVKTIFVDTAGQGKDNPFVVFTLHDAYPPWLNGGGRPLRHTVTATHRDVVVNGVTRGLVVGPTTQSAALGPLRGMLLHFEGGHDDITTHQCVYHNSWEMLYTVHGPGIVAGGATVMGRVHVLTGSRRPGCGGDHNSEAVPLPVAVCGAGVAVWGSNAQVLSATIPNPMWRRNLATEDSGYWLAHREQMQQGVMREVSSWADRISFAPPGHPQLRDVGVENIPLFSFPSPHIPSWLDDKQSLEWPFWPVGPPETRDYSLPTRRVARPVGACLQCDRGGPLCMLTDLAAVDWALRPVCSNDGCQMHLSGSLWLTWGSMQRPVKGPLPPVGSTATYQMQVRNSAARH
eukprot:TRINITY_DN16459_c0_g1_i1.p1 TRINITY_DN16459_c0_g1~~TRINITY_DN16459_c0_g1_i1.p1  ORF type:complete len:517 (+),score=119.64 TRINITY_DN16459_c0_g1_i1:89-1552(+)